MNFVEIIEVGKDFFFGFLFVFISFGVISLLLTVIVSTPYFIYNKNFLEWLGLFRKKKLSKVYNIREFSKNDIN